MRILVKLFATLTTYRPGIKAGTPFEVELPEGASIQDLVDALKIPAEETKVVFVGGIIQELDHTLKEADEVGIFPPIGGG